MLELITGPCSEQSAVPSTASNSSSLIQGSPGMHDRFGASEGQQSGTSGDESKPFKTFQNLYYPIFAKLPWITMKYYEFPSLCKVHLYHWTVPFHLHVSYRLPSSRFESEPGTNTLFPGDSWLRGTDCLHFSCYQLLSTSAAQFAKCTEAADLNLVM